MKSWSVPSIGPLLLSFSRPLGTTVPGGGDGGTLHSHGSAGVAKTASATLAESRGDGDRESSGIRLDEKGNHQKGKSRHYAPLGNTTLLSPTSSSISK